MILELGKVTALTMGPDRDKDFELVSQEPYICLPVLNHSTLYDTEECLA